jgi:hypothetical protein
MASRYLIAQTLMTQNYFLYIPRAAPICEAELLLMIPAPAAFPRKMEPIFVLCDIFPGAISNHIYVLL